MPTPFFLPSRRAALLTLGAAMVLAACSKPAPPAEPTPPSQNVVNLQARAAGVLPIRVEVPRAGVSHQFVKPLVIGAAASVKLRYKRN